MENFFKGKAAFITSMFKEYQKGAPKPFCPLRQMSNALVHREPLVVHCRVVGAFFDEVRAEAVVAVPAPGRAGSRQKGGQGHQAQDRNPSNRRQTHNRAELGLALAEELRDAARLT